MILKYFELNKHNLKKGKYFLLYGNNQGLIQDIIDNNLKPNLPQNIFKYEEVEILRDIDNFKQNIFNKSFFENEKLLIINRITDKSFELLKTIFSSKLDDLYLILLSDSLEKKSKIRNYFEKENDAICIPVYEDNLQTLSNIVVNFMNKNNINVSRQVINIIVERAMGDRINLKNELSKIENYSLNKKKIDMSDIIKITNLSENYSISELVDNCLSKNKSKILKILNENNFKSEDCIIILRTFLIKLKRLIKLHEDLISNNENIEVTVSSFRPPIFWKDKEIVKKQIRSFNYKETKHLIEKANDIELLVKKNPQNSLNFTTDFVMSHAI